MAKKLYENMNPQQIQNPISQKFNLDIKFSQKQKTQYGEGEEKAQEHNPRSPRRSRPKRKHPYVNKCCEKNGSQNLIFE